MASKDPGHAVILARIRLALRRATGQAADLDALLSTPEQAAAAFAGWRALGIAEIDRLLDQFEALDAPAPPPRRSAERVSGSTTLAPRDEAAAPAADDDDDPPPPPRQYIRGAR